MTINVHAGPGVYYATVTDDRGRLRYTTAIYDNRDDAQIEAMAWWSQREAERELRETHQPEYGGEG